MSIIAGQDKLLSRHASIRARAQEFREKDSESWEMLMNRCGA